MNLNRARIKMVDYFHSLTPDKKLLIFCIAVIVFLLYALLPTSKSRPLPFVPTYDPHYPHNNDLDLPPQALETLDKAALLIIPQLILKMHWSSGEAVLDYNAGDGAVGYYLLLPQIASVGGHLYSVEETEKLSEMAIDEYSDPRISYALGSLFSYPGDFPFPEMMGNFQKIFAIGVFQKLRDLKQALRVFNVALEEDGYLAFTTLTETSWQRVVALELSRMGEWNEYMEDYEEKYHPKWSEIFGEYGWEKKFGGMWAEEGFKLTYLEVKHLELHFTNVREIVAKEMIRMGPALSKVPDILIPKLVETFVQLFVKVTGIPEDAKGFNITHLYVTGIAKKVL